jgi:hypothetical protein
MVYSVQNYFNILQKSKLSLMDDWLIVSQLHCKKFKLELIPANA